MFIELDWGLGGKMISVMWIVQHGVLSEWRGHKGTEGDEGDSVGDD